MSIALEEIAAVAQQLSEPRRREAFVALVAAQDEGLSVADSRKRVAAEFGVELSVVETIEKDGLREAWPPLNE